MPSFKSFLKIFPRTYLSRMLFFAIADIVAIILAVWLSFLLRFDGQIPQQYFSAIKLIIPLLIVFILPIFYFQKLYSFTWAYVSISELVSLLKAAIAGFLFLGLAIFISRDYPSFTGFPRSTLFVSFILMILFSGGTRFVKRAWLEIFKLPSGKNKKMVLIVGAGDAGEQLLRSIQFSSDGQYFPIGFVDDNPIKQAGVIHGLKVLGKISDIPKIVSGGKIEEMIIALPSAEKEDIKRAVESGRKAGLKRIKIVPPVSEIINSEISIRSVRDVQVEDLLGRKPVSLDFKLIEDFVRGKTVLITGAAGSVGSELCRQISKFYPSSLILLDQDETGIFNISEELKDKFPDLKIVSAIANIQDKKKIDQVFSQFRPQIVFHAAAYKHVPLMELNPDEAVKNNIFGTRTIAERSLEYKAEKFIFISTDKAVSPVSIMGATKRIGEMICQSLNGPGSTKFISVRFGNVLDSRGSVIPIFREQIKKGGPVEVTHPEMKRYFMVISEAVLLVLQAGAVGQGGEVFVLDMGKPVKILDLAREMVRLSGFEPDKNIPIVFIGPRPGEKLFEEILTSEEGTIATQNQNIYKAKLLGTNKDKLDKGLEELKSAVEKSDRERITNVFKDLIPYYKPSVDIKNN